MDERPPRPPSGDRSAPTRREVLSRVAGATVAVAGAGGVADRASADPVGDDGGGATDDASHQSDGFDPSVHGFGFPNWWGETGCAVLADECPEHHVFTLPYEPVSREAVRSAISTEWIINPSRETVELLARTVHSVAVRQLATNGHCYGMVLAAEEFASDPGGLPAGAESASEVPLPTDGYEAVGRLIRNYHANQLLDDAVFWLSLFSLEVGQADLEVSLEQTVEALDATGTAGVIFGGLADGHQVLAYDYERDDADGVVRFALYDPEIPATEYEGGGVDGSTPTATVDADTGELVDSPYAYETWLYNDPESDLDLLDRLVGGVGALLERLDGAVLVSVGPPATLSVDAPDGATVVPMSAVSAPAGATSVEAGVGDAVLVLGADPAEYTIDVDGDVGEYPLEVFGVSGGEVVANESVTAQVVAVGDRFALAVDEAGEATLERVEPDTAPGGGGSGVGWPAVVGGGAAAAVGLGLAYRYLSPEPDEEGTTRETDEGE